MIKVKITLRDKLLIKPGKGIYEQLQSSYQYKYQTASFNIFDIQEAIGDFFYGKDPASNPKR